jgi:hypothetical protein
MGLFFLCRCLAVNQVLFDLSRSQVDRLSGPLSVHLLESSLGLPLSQSKMETVKISLLNADFYHLSDFFSEEIERIRDSGFN